jgi:predicted alpha/beta hydrolase family esterase
MNYLIIPGFWYRPKHNWYPWLAEHLRKQGHTVVIMNPPRIPIPWLWKRKARTVLKSQKGQWTIIGHSMGAVTALMLASYPQIVRVIAVTPWIYLDRALTKYFGRGVRIIETLWSLKPSTEQVQSSLFIFLSRDDYFVPYQVNHDALHYRFDKASIITLSEHGHATYDDGCHEASFLLPYL